MNELDYRRLTMLTNLYYILMEASDMFLRRAKVIIESNNKGLNKEIKRRHNLLMRIIKLPSTLQTLSWRIMSALMASGRTMIR